VVPAQAELVLTLDVVALRSSPWTRSMLAAGSEREGRARGFDQIADVDRVLLVRLPADVTGFSLSIAQGRFERARVRAALAAATPGLATASFRGCTIWTAGDEATAFLTDRTLLRGALASVRAAIDTSYGRARDLRDAPWVAELRARYGKVTAPAAIELWLKMSDPVRERLRQELLEAEGLERVGARLELGDGLDLAVVGTTATRQQAAALIARLGSTLRELQTRPSLEALGLGPVLIGVQLAVKGPRVAAELRLRESDREEIARRLSSVARLLASRARAERANPTVSGRPEAQPAENPSP
jgi:hypothetical protein